MAVDSAALQRHKARQSRFAKEVMVLVQRPTRAARVGAVRGKGFCSSVYAPPYEVPLESPPKKDMVGCCE